MRRSVILFTFFFGLAAHGQDLSPGASGKDPADLFSRIWSPYCHGISLLECPSSQAEDLRKEIRIRIKAGETEEAIFTELNKKHDGLLRMEPAHEGRESLAYWIPWTALFVAATFVGLFWRFRKMKAKNVQARDAGPSKNSKILEDLNARL